MSNPTDALPGLVSETPAKRLAGSDDLVVRRLSNYKPRKVVAFDREFPKNCGRNANKCLSLSETEMESACDMAMETNSPFTDGTDIAQSEPFSDVHCTNAVNVEAPIAAVPLTTVKPINLSDMESSGAECAADGVEVMEGEAFNQQPENPADVAKIQKVVSVLTEGVDPMTLTKRPGLSSKSEGDDDEGEICILSEYQWNEQRLLTKRNCDEAKVSIGKTDELLDKCAKDDNLAIVESACNAEPKFVLDRDLINLSITEHDHPVAVKVRETLKLFDEYYVEFSHKSNNIKGKGAHTEATNRLKVENRLVRPEKPFGHIPGIEIGHKFQFRCELLIIGLHCQHMSGIDSVVLDGKKLATSIVHSGRYKDQGRTGDVLIYSGQGGGYSKASDTFLDQKLENGNLALVNAKEMGYPVRVTYKSKRLGSTISSVRKDNFEYVYDGLYNVISYWEYKTEMHKVFKFELHRLTNQPRPQQTPESSRRLLSSMEACVLDDISDGKEKMKIRVVNNGDCDFPFPFAYVANMVYPKRKEPIDQLIGCDCINGCSDLHPCQCVMKNGGEIPYNEDGEIIRAKPIVHECGPQCKCPSTCMNRVSQHGPKHELEIFKTKLMGWGLRSRTHIPSGSFICEYVGELLQDNEADERSNDEYLFDIFNDDAEKDGFAIDAAVHGNIGRFINHHCSPNLYAQEVLYDHDDKRMPHIMFFAVKNIPPLKELSYDYNYKIDKVCDKSGNIKMKYCKCGSRVCTGRLY